MTPFTPLKRKKIIHFEQRKHSTSEKHPHVLLRNQQSRDKNAALCIGLGGRTVGCPDSKYTIWAKHCWTHPRWGWVCSELSVLHPDVSCCLAEGGGRWWGRGGGLHNSFSLTQLSKPPSTYTKQEVGSGARPQKRKGKKKKDKQMKKEKSAVLLPIARHSHEHFYLTGIIFFPAIWVSSSAAGKRSSFQFCCSFWSILSFSLTPYTANCSLEHEHTENTGALWIIKAWWFYQQNVFRVNLMCAAYNTIPETLTSMFDKKKGPNTRDTTLIDDI